VKSNWLRISVILIVVLAVALALTAGDAANLNASNDAPKPVAKKLPKLLDLGSDKCVPCKMMIPVLDDLKKDYKGQLEVQFIDVWKDKKASETYKVKSIPTQVFFDATGKEIDRHVGYIAKDDIIKTFEKHGIKFKKPGGK
jgi:thioredoxin 1